jgi:CheY-like chemotaxis protein
MGLSTVHNIMHEHDGHIKVYSSEESGTTISLLFPASEEGKCREIVENDDYDPMPGNQRKILVVDDDKIVGSFITELLSSQDYVPVLKTGSFDALDHYSENYLKYDAVIVDQIMPGMLGSELVAKMMDIDPNLNAIICSGDIENVDIDSVPQDVAVLPKPINLSDFFQELDNLIH